jgi:hypothetical protein
MLAHAAAAQCPVSTWTRNFETQATGIPGNVFGLQVFDPDGPGPQPAELYAAGNFASAGGSPLKSIARWNGQRWAEVGGGLYRANGNPGAVYGLGLHDPDGPGPAPAALIAAGSFAFAGTTPVANVASWNGAQWSAMGSGLTLNSNHMPMCNFDEDGPGPLPPSLILCATGQLVRWYGSQWSTMLLPGWIFALATFDEDGPGPANESLFAGVKFQPGLLKWEDGQWNPVGGGLRSAFHMCAALRVIDEDGPGPVRPALFAGGGFSEAGTTTANGVARWDGSTWSVVATGIADQITDLAAVDYTGGLGPPAIYAVGDIGGFVYRWKTGEPQWAQVGASNGSFGVSVISRLAAFDEDGPGPGQPSLYLSGSGLTAVSAQSHWTENGQPSYGIARYACQCYPNCDDSTGNPRLTSNDLLCFANRFASGHSYANCDGSTGTPALTPSDFICFLNVFASGCE